MAGKKYTLVTGASSGIGRAIAVKLSGAANLLLHGRNLKRLEETRNLCAPGEHLLWSCDLERVESVQENFEGFVACHGIAIDQFVHAAGIVLLTAVRSFDLALLRKMIDTNAISAMLLTGSLLKGRIAGKTMRSIVLVSSVTGLTGTRGKSLYGTSKGMLNAFVRSSAVELAPGVRINSICPAAVETEMSRELFADPEAVAAMNRCHPLGTGKPEDVAGVVAFLLSDEARWITGQQFVVDGGALVNLTFK